jgi:hypothetical protein
MLFRSFELRRSSDRFLKALARRDQVAKRVLVGGRCEP